MEIMDLNFEFFSGPIRLWRNKLFLQNKLFIFSCKLVGLCGGIPQLEMTKKFGREKRKQKQKMEDSSFFRMKNWMRAVWIYIVYLTKS